MTKIIKPIQFLESQCSIFFEKIDIFYNFNFIEDTEVNILKFTLTDLQTRLKYTPSYPYKEEEIAQEKKEIIKNYFTRAVRTIEYLLRQNNYSTFYSVEVASYFPFYLEPIPPFNKVEGYKIDLWVGNTEELSA